MNYRKYTIYKIITVLKHVANWYYVPFDKMFGRSDATYKFRNGICMECRPKSTDINEAVVVLSGMEYPLVKYKSKKCKPKVVFDLGGNIGSFALYFDMLYKEESYEGHVFEPHPGNFDLLERNLRLNDVKNFRPVKKAVSGVNGQLKFDVSGGYDAFRIDSESQKYITVDSVRLSDYCRNHGIDGIDLLKIDIEGGEYDVFRLDFDFLMRSVKTIMLEYHNIDEKKNIDYVVGVLDKGFDLKIERGDKGGGILTATNKYIN